MNPIIDPMVFYYGQLLQAAYGIGIFVSSVLAFGYIVLVVGLLTGDVRMKETEEVSLWKLVGFFILIVMMFLGSLSIPTKNTYYRMVIARNLTPNNLEQLQGLADDTMESLKGDIIDIIHGVTEPRSQNEEN